MILSRDDILKAEDISTETVKCPEWGGDVLVRPLTGKERDKLEADVMIGDRGQVDPINVTARVVALTVVDDDGNPLFTRDDVEALGAKNSRPLNRIYTVAARLSGLSKQDVEEMTANFGGEGGAGSPSSSPKSSAKPAKNSSGKSPAAN